MAVLGVFFLARDLPAETGCDKMTHDRRHGLRLTYVNTPVLRDQRSKRIPGSLKARRFDVAPIAEIPGYYSPNIAPVAAHQFVRPLGY